MASPFDFRTSNSDLGSRIASEVRRALSSDDPVIVRGDRGVGKVRLARAIHDGSSRRRGHFEYLACSGMPDTLVASEIVGHCEGSFPGALRDKRSASAWRAHEGTLVVGDVGNLGPRSRQALAGLIRTGDVIPVGARGAVGNVDVRVILFTEGPLDAPLRDVLGRFIEVNVPSTDAA